MKLNSNRRLALLGGGLLVAFAALSMTAFRQTLTPYVSFNEARAAQRTVQIAGELEKGSSGYDTTEQSLLFTLRDPKSRETVRVRYHGLRPANFEDALSIVAIGRFDPASREMKAEKLLVKCPSKYQGVETKTYG
jgi:cytochrome c-type biogenesis protein CcmE